MILRIIQLKNPYFIINHICFIVGVAACAWSAGQTTPLAAQDLVVETTTQATETKKTVQLQGLVTSRKKYSFTVSQNQTEYTVRLSPGAPIGLKMNRPWFDWKRDQVVVDALGFPGNPQSQPADRTKRVAFKLPAEKLFLISRLGNAARINTIMSADEKRINFYLLTPDDPGQHFPTAEQPYLSGPLSVDELQARVEIDDQTLPVKLGFRFATMNGFTINQLEPNKTQVFLSGNWADGATNIEATSVLFQPVVLAQTVPEQVDDPLSSQPVAK